MNPTLLLAIATLALVVGPLFDRLAARYSALSGLVDGATVGGIVVVSFVHLMPEAGAHLGWWALVLLAVGLTLPTLAERLIQQGNDSLKVPIGVLIVLLLLAHEVIESAALASVANEERVGIATLLVVVGHRLPLGLILWGQTKRRFGMVWSVAALVAVASLTWFGPVLVPVEPGTFTAVLSALLAGGLLHLVLQHAPAAEQTPRPSRHFWSALGMVLAIGMFVPYLTSGAPPEDHAHGPSSSYLPERLTELVLETAPTLLIGVLGAALIEAFLPASTTRWLSTGSRLRRALAGVALGTPMPVCSCGILPIYRSLVRKRVGAVAAMALLIAAPEIGVDSFLLSLGMLGVKTTLARLACAILLALAIALIVGSLADAEPIRELPHEHAEERPRGTFAAIRFGLLETWAHLSPWIVLGLVVTALVEPWISTEWALSTPAWVQVLALSLIGMPTYICATAATPFAALLLAKGFAPGAVIAFLLTGPATNLTTFLALKRIHSMRVAVAFVLVAVVTTFAAGNLVDLVLAGQPLEPLPLAEHTHGWVAWGSAAVLAALTLWVLFRAGPRAYLAQLWSAEPSGEHAHDHAPAAVGPGDGP